MAGTDPRFDAAKVRAALHFAMKMGSPTKPSEDVIFRWNTVETFQSKDPAGRPYDFGSTPTTSTSKPDVVIDTAGEFSARPSGSRDTEIGHFDTSRMVLTILDDDIDKVRDADLVIIDGNEYRILFIAPPDALFDMTVYQMYLEAVDES